MAKLNSDLLDDPMKLCCSNKKCPDCGKLDAGNLIKYGYDRKKNQRYQCKTCGRGFVFNPPHLEPWQRKKAQKGHKSQRNQGEYYDERKDKETLSLTATAVKRLDELAKSLGISRSELVERLGRYERVMQREGGLFQLGFSLRPDTTS